MSIDLPEYLDLCTEIPPFEKAKNDFIARYLRTVMTRNRGHQQRAAEEMGVHRNTLMRLLDQTGVPRRYGLPRRRIIANPTDAAARRLIGLKPLPPKPVRASDLPAWSPIRRKMVASA